MTHKTFLIALVALLAFLPVEGAFAYINPEDVLLNRQLFLPPTARDAQARTNMQTEESNARREREQERAFALQNPPVQVAAPAMAVLEATSLHGAAGVPPLPQAGVSSADLELLRTMRLLTRIQSNQQTVRFGGAAVLHAGAPSPLAPTGAGGILAAITMLGAVGWTVRKAKRGKGETRVS